MFKLCVYSLFFISLFTAAKPKIAEQKLAPMFQQAVESTTVPGINVAIADTNGLVWAKGFGLADIENQVPMTPKHKMRIGSVAKLITVAAMMRLHEQGKLKLSKPIRQYVPSWPAQHADITLAQLAAHTAGVRHYKNDAEFLLNQHFADTSASLAIFKDDPLLFAPGTQLQYSTFAYSLIGAAMEGADNQRSFKHIIQQEVFTPLSMHDTVFDDKAPIISFRQRPYVAQNGQLFNAPQSDHSYKYAGGGFLATPVDISRFAVAHTKQGYLSKQSLNTLFSRAQLQNGQAVPFGIGWMIGFDNFKNRSYYQKNARAQKLMASIDNAVMHSGGSNGGTTMLILCRDHQLSVTVVKNVDGEHSADVFLLALESLAFSMSPFKQ